MLDAFEALLCHEIDLGGSLIQNLTRRRSSARDRGSNSPPSDPIGTPVDARDVRPYLEVGSSSVLASHDIGDTNDRIPGRSPVSWAKDA
jgi:hypothetical protein